MKRAVGVIAVVGMKDPANIRYSTTEPRRAVVAARWIRSGSWCAIWLAMVVPMLAVLRIVSDTAYPPTGDGMWIFGTAIQILIEGKTLISGAVPVLPLMLPVVFMATAADQRPSYVTWIFGAAAAAIAVRVGFQIHPESVPRFILPLLKFAIVGGALSGFAADWLARLTGISTIDPDEHGLRPVRGTRAIVAGSLVVLTMFLWRELWPR